ncbi:MAG: cell envelope integrity protein TolA [Epsilonproteobacteria bacterium]|nr:cell envelope integrity protein TolA [Campylobacterota bacterium]
MSKLTSGILAIGIYLGLIFLILLYYNIHKIKAKNYVEKNSNRVTVTLVNSDKTVFNKSSKKSTPIKPRPSRVHHNVKPIKTHIPTSQLKHITPPVKKEPKKVTTPTKKELEAKRVAQAQRRAKERKKRLEQERVAQLAKDKKKKEAQRLARIKREQEAKKEAQRIKREQEAKKEQERLARIKKEKEKKEQERLARIKKEKEKKERERLARIKREKEAKKRRERERQARIREEERKKRAKNLFSSVNTNTANKSPKRPKEQSHIRHNSSVVDRIKNTHQSGRVSNRNRERGVENAYIAKVEKQLRNWNAQSNYKGQSATIKLTIFSSGKFRYTIKRSSSMALSSGLREFLDQLNRIGLGQHNKSTPYVINVTFRAR